MSKITDIQTILGVTPDGQWGRKSQAALDAAIDPIDWVHHVKASSFADPKDVAAFRAAKARGLSDQEAFKVGDNGFGVWGDDTTVDVPMCALPPEDWQRFGASPRGRKIKVEINDRIVICELRDTMPHTANITNGAGIDLNYAACKAFGLTPPIMVPALWQPA